MRIKLKKGKQKELILLTKKGLSWKEFAKKLNINHVYLSSDIKNENRLISEELYQRLCKLSKFNYEDERSSQIMEL